MVAAGLSPRRCAVACVLIYLVLAFALSWAKLPYCDEALLASPALNLATKGYMGTSVLDETSAWREGMSLAGIHRYTYAVMPLDLLTQAVWYKALGFGLVRQRALSVLWGLVALASWFFIAERLAGPAVAALTVGLLSLDAQFLAAASLGRADMASAALGYAGLAVYLRWHERKLGVAILASQACAAAGLFTHPVALLCALSLLALTLSLDWQRLRITHLLLAATPYLVAAAGWGMYIAQAPSLFVEQFASNSRGRVQIAAPWHILAREIGERYLTAFGGTADASRSSRAKLLLLGAYFLAFAGVLCMREVRRHAGYRTLVIVALIQVGGMTFLEATKQDFYLIHTIPALTAILALWICLCWRGGKIPRWALAGGVCVLLAIQVSRVGHVVLMDAHHKQYAPAADFLARPAHDSKLIMADAIFAYRLGFADNLVDDLRLGYRSHKTPELIVVNERYQEFFDRMRTLEPEAHAYVKNLLAGHFEIAYENEAFRIYRKRH